MSSRPRAFILMGGLDVVLRNWLYLTELDRRGLSVLVVTAEGARAAAQQAMAASQWPATLIAEAGFVAGEVGIEGSLTAGVMAQVMDWRQRYEVAGVFSIGEMFVEQSGIIADLLGLRSPGPRATRVCRSKYLQRAYLPEWSPRSMVLAPGQRHRADLSGITFPAVVKPAARRASSGVRAVFDAGQLAACLAGYPPGETLLVEEYVTGPEFSVELLAQDGEIIFASLTAKRTNEGDSRHFVELGHTVPAPPGEHGAALLEAGRAIARRLAISDGIAHAEFRLAPGGRVVLMEIAARTPGDGLLPLYHLATGRPMEPEVIRITLGEPASYPQPRRYCRQVYLETGPGTLRDVEVSYPGAELTWVPEDAPWPEIKPGQPGDPPALRAVLALKHRGEPVGRLTESDDRPACFLIDADSPAELDELEAAVRASVRLSVTPD